MKIDKNEHKANIFYALAALSVLLGLAGLGHWMYSIGAVPYILKGLAGLCAIALAYLLLFQFGKTIRGLLEKKRPS